jgi:hypothetical protein
MAPVLPPDHKPLPSPFDELPRAVGVSLTAATLSLPGLCPADLPHQQTDDPPQENHAPMAYRVPAMSVSSTSGAAPPRPLTWQNNSQFASADAVIRHHLSRRAAQTRIAQMSLINALFFGTNGSSGAP